MVDKVKQGLTGKIFNFLFNFTTYIADNFSEFCMSINEANTKVVDTSAVAVNYV